MNATITPTLQPISERTETTPLGKAVNTRIGARSVRERAATADLDFDCDKTRSSSDAA